MNYLFGGFNNLEKYEFVNGKDDIPYMKWKITQPCLKPPTRHVNLVVMVYNHHTKIPVLTIVAMFIITIWYIYP
jgi:hypothetical protein